MVIGGRVEIVTGQGVRCSSALAEKLSEDSWEAKERNRQVTVTVICGIASGRQRQYDVTLYQLAVGQLVTKIRIHTWHRMTYGGGQTLGIVAAPDPTTNIRQWNGIDYLSINQSSSGITTGYT